MGKLQVYFTKLRKLIFKHLTFLLWTLIFIKGVRTKRCIMYFYDTINNPIDRNILNSGKILFGTRPDKFSEYLTLYRIVRFCNYPVGLSGRIIWPDYLAGLSGQILILVQRYCKHACQLLQCEIGHSFGAVPSSNTGK